jgi:DNA repair photolyase
MALITDKTIIVIDGRPQSAFLPVIISASRATDIPAFHAEWFMNRLKAGYAGRINPFNQIPQYVSFEKTRVLVFWTKNAKPMMKYLDDLDRFHINYYFTFTVNDYEEEALEPGLPPLEERIKTFKELSRRIGMGRVVWRFDPLILGEKLTVQNLLKKIEDVGGQLFKYTKKLVISFVDINCYKKTASNLKQSRKIYREFTGKDVETLAKGLQRLNNRWHLDIATCAEKYNLEGYGIKHNRCVDDKLMIREFKNDRKLMEFLGYEEVLFNTGIARASKKLKDKGQRKECGCITSRDIGIYSTCGHLCLYCYANGSRAQVTANLERTDKGKDSII